MCFLDYKFLRGKVMKSAIKKIWDYIEGINGLLLIIYTSLALISYVVIKSTTGLQYIIRDSLFAVVVSVIICPLLIRFVRNKSLDGFNKNYRFKLLSNYRLLGLLAFIISLTIFFLYFVAYFPGGFSGDQLNQYMQTITDDYNDWHNVLHTLMFFKLPLLIFNGWIGSLLIFQNILFSGVIAYMVYAISKHANGLYAVLAFIFIIFNPLTRNMASYVFKDTAFAMGALLLMTYVFNIVFSNGKWCCNVRNVVFLIAALVITTFMRHNAILFTFPVLIVILFLTTKKRFFTVLVSFILACTFIKFPLYSVLDVQQPGSRRIESLGLPLSVIGAVAKYNPDALDTETEQFVYKLATKEEWQKYYSYTGFNSIKFSEHANVDEMSKVIDQEGVLKILSHTMKCFINSPVVSAKAVFSLTDPLYSLQNLSPPYLVPQTVSNDLNIQYGGNAKIKNYLVKIDNLTNFLFPHLFTLSIMNYLIILLVCSKCRLATKYGLKRAAIALPTLSYNFGTMLLLTGSWDCCRFFYYTFIIIPILIIVFMSPNTKDVINA